MLPAEVEVVKRESRLEEDFEVDDDAEIVSPSPPSSPCGSESGHRQQMFHPPLTRLCLTYSKRKMVGLGVWFFAITGTLYFYASGKLTFTTMKFASMDVNSGTSRPLINDKSNFWTFNDNLQTTPNTLTDEQRSEGKNCTFPRLARRQCSERFQVSMLFLVGGGLGNLMFQYATLYATARTYNMKPVMWRQEEIFKYFQLAAEQTDDPHFNDNWRVLDVPFPKESAINVKLGGYNQRYIHFEAYGHEIRKEFTFLDPIRRDTKKNMRAALLENGTAFYRSTMQNKVKIGVHVRRGDFLQPHNVDHGFTVASASYLAKAMRFYRQTFNNNVTFIVISDDMRWTTENIRSVHADVHFFHGTRSDDLYLMSLCDHVVATVGTFSWWAGFLAGGTVVYYKNFPRQDSDYYKFFRAEEYYPSDWIPMGD